MGTKNTYLMVDEVYIPNEELEGTDPYQHYYWATRPQPRRRRRVKVVQVVGQKAAIYTQIDKTVVHERRDLIPPEGV